MLLAVIAHNYLYRPARHRKVFPPFFLLLCSRRSSRQKNSLKDMTAQKLEESCSEHGCSFAEEQEKRREICVIRIFTQLQQQRIPLDFIGTSSASEPGQKPEYR